MKNIALKIVILIVSIAAAVGLVLIFWRSILSAPPTKMGDFNEHEKVISTGLNNIRSYNSFPVNDSLFYLYKDKIDVFESNDLIDPDQADENNQYLVNEYIPIFKAYCLSQFSQQGWGESCFSFIQKHINDLRGVRLQDHSSAVSNNREQDLSDIEEIMDTYQAAKRIAAIRSFYNVESARKNINDAQSYLNTDYIGISDLKEKLEKVKPSIAGSHYRQMEKKILDLREYMNMDKDEYNELAQSINKQIETYINCNNSIYGHTGEDASVLQDMASNFYQEGYQYYQLEERKRLQQLNYHNNSYY